jgi:hypothetical protein
VKPVTVSIEVPRSREEVYDFLDVLGNHEGFTDHFLVDWEVSGPQRGTYRLESIPNGSTSITFELAWLEAPLIERLAAPLTRA